MDLDKSLKPNMEQPNHIYSFQNLEEYDKRLSDWQIYWIQVLNKKLNKMW